MGRSESLGVALVVLCPSLLSDYRHAVTILPTPLPPALPVMMDSIFS